MSTTVIVGEDDVSSFSGTIGTRRMGAYSVTPNCRLRIHRARFCQDVSRSRHVRGNPGRAGSSRTPSYDMGQHFDRSAGRFGGAGGRFRDSCQHTDGNVVVRSNFHCASAERIQLSEACLSNRCWPAIRTGRLRSRPAVSSVLGSTYLRWSRAVFPGFFSSEAGTLNECVKWSPIVLLQRKGQDEKDPYGHLDGPVTGSTKPHCTCPNTVEPDCAGHH